MRAYSSTMPLSKICKLRWGEKVLQGKKNIVAEKCGGILLLFDTFARPEVFVCFLRLIGPDLTSENRCIKIVLVELRKAMEIKAVCINGRIKSG